MGTDLGQQGREIDRSAWEPYFEDLNKRIEQGALFEANVEIVGEIGDSTEAEHLPLNGITWEDADDQIAIGLGGRDQRYPAVLYHYVDRPRRLVVREEGSMPTAIIIDNDDEDEMLTVVRLYSAG